MEEKLISIATRMLGLTEGEVTIESTPTNTMNWDSLAHMRLILEVEDQFGLELDEGEIIGIVDMKSLSDTILRHQD
jgi:acyl carrier protein